MPCPFLGTLSPAFVRNYGANLLKQYGKFCPTVSRGFRSLGQDETKCPFIAEAPREMTEDIVEPPQVYPYEKFFKEQIEAKKKEHSYRVFKRVARLAGEGEYPRALEGDGHRVTVWCANDYLGASRHPAVRSAAAAALDAYGAGAGGTRNIAGNTPLVEQLEAELAALHDKPAALVFSSCFVANDATLCTLARLLPGCHVFSDAGNHASMIQGIRNSRAPKHIFRHNDPAHLRQLLEEAPRAAPKLVAFETVHSMSGAICPLKELCDIAHEFGALTFVDEVHAVGMYGDRGAGVAEERGLADHVDIVSGTLGKAYGNVGGYIAGPAALVDAVRSLAPGFIFTTALPPATLAGALAAVRLLAGSEGAELRAAQRSSVRQLKRALLVAGLPQLPSVSHIVPVPVRGAAAVARVADALLSRGHYAQAINHPTVARGEERLRFAPGPHHEPHMVTALVDALADSFREAGVRFDEFMRDGACRECSLQYRPDLWEERERRPMRVA